VGLFHASVSSSGQSRNAKLPLSAVAFLVLTVTISLFWSHYKLLWNDELSVLQTDSVSSLAQLVHIQRTCPLSFDPIAYHVLAWLAIRLFGAGAFAIRLPALLGFLLMQICLFFFVRQVASERAAVFALAYPALGGALYYSAEGRPYGLLLGFCALAMVSWQTATRSESKRTLALVTLALSTALALNTHYYGVLLLVPLCGAEMFRTFQRRRLDFPVIAAIGAGMAWIVFTLPFMKAAREFSLHYSGTGLFSLGLIPLAYRTFLADYPHAYSTFDSMSIRHALVVSFVLLIVLGLWGCIRQPRNLPLLPKAEAVFLILLAALPLFGYLLARFVTHTVDPRYVIPAFVGVTSLLAILLSPLFRHNRAGKLALVALFLAIAFVGFFRIYAQRISMKETMSALVLTPEAKAALLASPSGLLYLQDMGGFESASYYEPDAEVRSRLALVYSANQEMLWSHHDNDARLAMHLHNFTRLTVVPYESIATQPGDHIFVDYKGAPWDWADQSFSAAHANVRPLGHAFGGDLMSVRFLP
jgi:hypothetical protein